ncbi:MAG: hypothetical protein JWM10_3692 [Myxococcaceae bacterium]|nr:hypothetical protein [Myxococcaceae bacterium]
MNAGQMSMTVPPWPGTLRVAWESQPLGSAR